MAYLVRHPNSPFWSARWRDEQGIVRNRSTRETDRAKAIEIALGWEHAARLARRGELTADKAREVVAEILERISGGRETIRSTPTDKFLREWLVGREADDLAPATLRGYTTSIGLFLDHLGDRRTRPLTAISSADIESFLRVRGEARANRTVALSRKALNAAFNDAVRHGLVDRNPCFAARAPARNDSQERQPFGLEEIRALIATAEGDWRTCVLVGFYTGARLSDVANLDWTTIDLLAGTLTYRQRKTSEGVVTPLHPALQAHLELVAGDRGGPLMPTLAGRDASRLCGEFLDLMARAGVGSPGVRLKSGRLWRAKSFHSLRHSFETHLARANVSAELRRELGGRTDEAVQRVYTHLQLDQMRAALGKLPTLL